MTTAETYYIVVYPNKAGYASMDKYLAVIPGIHAPALTGMLQNAARFADRKTAEMWLAMNQRTGGEGHGPGQVEELEYLVTYKRRPLKQG